MKHYTLSFDLFEELPQQKRESQHIRAQCAECMSGKNHCSVCSTHKTPDSFYWNNKQKTRRQSQCRECNSIRNNLKRRSQQGWRSLHLRAQCAECMSGKNYCIGCKTHKTPDSFNWYIQQQNSRQSYYCRECKSIRRKQDYEHNHAKIVIRNRVSRYNITAQEYLCLLASQDNKCAICDVVFDPAKRGSGTRGQPNVDHDHATGKVRELLCSSCNHGLGCFRDNINALGKAMAYLTKHKSR